MTPQNPFPAMLGLTVAEVLFTSVPELLPMRKRFTTTELARVRELRRQNIKYKVIGERLGRSARCLIATMHAPPERPIDLREARVERFIEKHVSGMSVKEIALEVGLTAGGLDATLRNWGYDGEMRKLARAENANRPAMQIGRATA